VITAARNEAKALLDADPDLASYDLLKRELDAVALGGLQIVEAG